MSLLTSAVPGVVTEKNGRKEGREKGKERRKEKRRNREKEGRARIAPEWT